MIGDGVYSLSEVSRYTGIAAATVRSWFKPRSDHTGLGPLFEADYRPVGNDFAVSFLNLVERYVARYFRVHGVKAWRIRRVYAAVQLDLNSPHPFARQDLFTDGIDIFRRVGESVDDPEIVDVLTRPRQRVFGKWCDYLGRFDYANKTIRRWHIAAGIVIDPQVSFGKPIIQSTGITTYVLANQYHANKRNAALVADLFAVEEQDVLRAVDFETRAVSMRSAA
jgi:uncharacterized protein (DUF433 family)